MNHEESAPYQTGRQFYSPTARVWNIYGQDSDTAYQLVPESTYVCVPKIIEKSGYSQLLRFYNFLTRASRDEVEKLLIDKKFWSKLSIGNGMSAQEFQYELLSYPLTVIRNLVNKHSKAKVNSVIPEDFIFECTEYLFDVFDREVPTNSLWTTSRPVLERVSITDCPHHPEEAYCFYIRKIRDWDFSIDPISPRELATLLEEEDSLEAEFDDYLKELKKNG